MKKDGRQPFRLWFEFYKLALKNPDLQNEIKKSREFYKAWGDIEGTKFDPWYETNKHLFADQLSITISDAPPKDLNPELLYLSVPRNWSVTKIVKQLKTDLDGKVGNIVTGKKHKNLPKSVYSTTYGKELKTTNMNFALVVYRDIYLKLGQPPINREFMTKVHQHYKSRPRKNKIPPSMGFEGVNINEESVLRNLRRYIKKAKLLELNAAKGVFPGDDYTD